jgi:hypothetical protein
MEFFEFLKRIDLCIHDYIEFVDMKVVYNLEGPNSI